LDAYRNAERIFTISELDKAVLQCLGLSAVCFPYFPPKEVCSFLLNVARERQVANKRFVLLLGSVINPPTKAGMEALIQELRGSKAVTYDVRVAGYGTNKLDYLASPRIEICGEVSSDKLRELLVGCEFVLMKQNQSSGFATRLIELNLCEVPVIVIGDYIQANDLEEYNIVRVAHLDDTAGINISTVPSRKFARPRLEMQACL